MPNGSTALKSKTKIFFGGAALIAVLLGGVIYYTVSKNTGANHADSRFRPAPKFTLEDSAGKPHSLEEFKGSLILLHFWASWCPPCLGEIPQWVDLANDYKGRPLKMIAISEDEKWEDALKILNSASLPPNVTSLLDLKGRVAEQYGSYQYPETYLLNSRLEIITKWVGGQEWKDPKLATFLNELINNGGTGQRLGQ